MMIQYIRLVFKGDRMSTRWFCCAECWEYLYERIPKKGNKKIGICK